MGIAVLSAVLDSLEARQSQQMDGLTALSNGRRPAPSTGTSTPTSSFIAEASDAAMPSRFIATVGREETVRKLKRTFKDIGGLAESVEILAGEEANFQAVSQADVVLVA
jgi:pyrroline-5-carboxylate reductase